MIGVRRFRLIQLRNRTMTCLDLVLLVCMPVCMPVPHRNVLEECRILNTSLLQ